MLCFGGYFLDDNGLGDFPWNQGISPWNAEDLFQEVNLAFRSRPNGENLPEIGKNLMELFCL